MTFCIQCGKMLNGDEKYCPACGHIVVSSVAATPAFCYACGENVTRSTATCPRCGADLRSAFAACDAATASTSARTVPSGNRKEPVVGIILSVLIFGLGTMYAGYVERGLCLLAAGVVCSFAALLFYPIAIVVIVLWIYGIYDAYEKCEEANKL